MKPKSKIDSLIEATDYINSRKNRKEQEKAASFFENKYGWIEKSWIKWKPLKLGKRGQFAVGHLIVGALIILLILGLAFIYIIMPDPTDFIAGLGWLDEALVGVAAVIGSAMVLNKVVLKK